LYGSNPENSALKYLGDETENDSENSVWSWNYSWWILFAQIWPLGYGVHFSAFFQLYSLLCAYWLPCVMIWIFGMLRQCHQEGQRFTLLCQHMIGGISTEIEYNKINKSHSENSPEEIHWTVHSQCWLRFTKAAIGSKCIGKLRLRFTKTSL